MLGTSSAGVCTYLATRLCAENGVFVLMRFLLPAPDLSSCSPVPLKFQRGALELQQRIVGALEKF